MEVMHKIICDLYITCHGTVMCFGLWIANHRVDLEVLLSTCLRIDNVAMEIYVFIFSSIMCI